MDIRNNEALDLVLPSREQIVENQKLAVLRDECRLASYRHIVHKGGAHRLPFKW